MPSEIEKAYLAGIFDGEGSVYVTKRKSKTCRYGVRFELCCAIAMTDKPIIDWINKFYPTHIYVDKSGTKNGKICYKWRLWGQQATYFLNDVFPYLQVKSEQAKQAFLFREFQNNRKSTEENWNIANNFYLKLKELKKCPRE